MKELLNCDVACTGLIGRLRIGRSGIRLIALGRVAKAYGRMFVGQLEQLPATSVVTDEVSVLLVYPEVPDIDACPCDMTDDMRALSDTCHRAWRGVAGIQDAAGRQLSPPVSGSVLRDWRIVLETCEQVAPGSSLYKYCGPHGTLYIYFALPLERNHNVRWFRAMVAIAEDRHTQSGGLSCLHAACVVLGGLGFLFLGHSGAGKSTAALLAAEIGAQIVDDDRVAVACDGENAYSALSMGAWWLHSRDSKLSVLPPLYDVGSGVKLAGIMALRKDTSNRLVRVDIDDAAAILAEQMFVRKELLPLSNDVEKRISRNCHALASSIPAYELHFRKDTGFVQLITDAYGIAVA